MRVQVLFGKTSVLVPCGDGKLPVKELVDKAIVRFRKVLNKVGFGGGMLAGVAGCLAATLLCKHKVCVGVCGWFEPPVGSLEQLAGGRVWT